jgi:hypothetical protein
MGILFMLGDTSRKVVSMLRRSLLVVGVVLVAASVATVASAQPGGGGGFGGGMGMGMGMMGGGMMGGGATSVVQLLGMPTVQTELKLTDEQKTKVTEVQDSMRTKMQEAMSGIDFQGMMNMSPEERTKAQADMRKKTEPVTKDADEQAIKVLTPEQVDRVKQLQLQREGAAALSREEVAKKLGLKDDQIEKIKKLQETLSQPPQFDPNGDMQAQMQKMRDDRAKAQKDILAVLTEEQTTKWKEMQGKEFTFPQGRGRGMGRGGMGGGPGGGGPGGPGGPGGN